jgi:shikimate kinase
LIIALLGPKHSGKTSAGLELARRRGLPFFDLDRLIEERTGQSPRALYRAGPGLFRRAEEEALAGLLKSPAGERGVLAAGGGIIDNPRALDLLFSSGESGRVLVYLAVTAETAWRRIAGPGEDRELPPFLQAESAAASREKHRFLHERRRAAYEALLAGPASIPRIRVDGEGKTPAELAEEIEGLIFSLCLKYGILTL